MTDDDVMATYTVFGLVDNAAEPRGLTVAAVVLGDVPTVDTDDGMDETMQRWASSFEARDPDHAEALARAEVAGEDAE